MGEGIRIGCGRDAHGDYVELHVDDADLAGKRAKVRIERRAQVKRSNPVHKSETLHERELVLRPGTQQLPLGDMLAGAFAYQGEDLDLALAAHVTVDDGILFDTKLEADLARLCSLPPRESVPKDAKSVHSPRDTFDFIANLRAIPAKARMIVLGLLLAGGPVILVNALVGVRDQLVPESQVWFYDHTGDDGGESPLMKALAGSGAAGLAIWLAIRRQLQKYMRFEAKWPLARLERGARCRADEIVSGEAGVPLEQVRVRVVAYNREHGQHRVQEGSGKNRRTVTKEFSSDARGVVLFERLLPHVAAGEPLARHLDVDIDFDPLFQALYPPCRIGGTHGLSLALEAQLLHPEYVDHDVVLDPGQVDPAQFHAG
jgi:hypothetical protein